MRSCLRRVTASSEALRAPQSSAMSISSLRSNHLPSESNRQIVAVPDLSLSPPRPSIPDDPGKKAIFLSAQRQLTEIKSTKSASNIFECLLFVTHATQRGAAT